MNAKNQLQEHYQANGWPLEGVKYTHEQLGLSGGWRSTIDLTMPNGRRLAGTGEGPRKSDADVAAAANALATLPADTLDTAIKSDAQPGDARIKLAVYVTMAAATPEERSRWLQEHEGDSALALIFDRSWEAGDADVCQYGPGRSVKFKASVVEALVWRRFREHVLGPGAKDVLARLFAFIERGGPGTRSGQRPSFR